MNTFNDIKQEFDYSEEKFEQKTIITIVGEKNSGKTMTAFSFKGTKVVISFDKKSTPIKTNFYKDDKIRIYDGSRYLKFDEKNLPKSSSITYDYIIKIIEELYSNKIDYPDWIIIDGLEKVANVCEQKMRFVNKIKAFEYFSNFGLWKFRKSYLDHLHKTFFNHCKKGVIYTTYTKEETEIFNKEIKQQKKVPKWFGNIMEETDVVFRTAIVELDDNKRKYKVICEGSKIPSIAISGKSYLVKTTGIEED